MAQRLTSLGVLLWMSALFYGCSPENPTPPSQPDLSKNQLRAAVNTEPLTLDPRLARDLATVNVLHMLYEGLTHTGHEGKLELALAESVTISPDKKTYTFSLRESYWSDGQPLTATDFLETWQSILSPKFPAPNAYQLYVIKGGKAAKEGHLALSEVGIAATSPSTLIVTLEQPTPFFLNMLSTHFFYPVNNQLRKQSTSETMSAQEQLVGNGPFKIVHWKHRNEIATVKNPYYWDANAVKLNGVTLQVLDDNTALQMFKTGELDWVGSPSSTLPQDSIIALKQQGILNVAPAAGTHWFRFNTQKLPFSNEKMRKAFNLALDRKGIVEHITQGNQIPAMGIVPPLFGIENQNYFKDHDTASAQKMFMGALIDLKNSQEKLPEISLCYNTNDRNHKIAQAVQQQWNKAFGVNIHLESCESQVYYDKLHSGSYQISLGSWYADIRDPINFLEVFKSKDIPTNNTYWEDIRFTDLLNQSSGDISPEERNKQLAEAEKILIEGMPVAPLYHGVFNFLKNDDLTGVYFSELGYLDFKEASLNK